MRVLIAPDKFKGSLRGVEVAEAMRAGVLDVAPDAEVTLRPIADGGEGFLDAIGAATAGRVHHVPVQDSFGRPTVARAVSVGDHWYLEAAQAVGLVDAAPSVGDALRSDSGGVGQLLSAALDSRAKQVTVGLGGTSCTDGGAGLLRSLGARLLDGRGQELPPGGCSLAALSRIELSLDTRLSGSTLTAACDVASPILGPRGAARVFAPQKGADFAAVARLEEGLTRLADLLLDQHGLDLRAVPGGGAAGGIGASMSAVLGAEMRSGADLVFDLLDLRREIERSDVVITGEGSFDEQSLEGKGPMALHRSAASLGVSVIVIAGRSTLTASHGGLGGVAAVASLSDSFPDPFVDTASKVALITARTLSLVART